MLKAQEGVVFNVYPDSIGENLSALNDLFEKSDFKHLFLMSTYFQPYLIVIWIGVFQSLIIT